jgi:hypothetical protein
MLYYESVSPDLLSLLKKLQAFPELSGFRLVGGTSLSLQIGHRVSVDLDLFTDRAFDTTMLQNALSSQFPSFEVRWANQNGFTSVIEDIKVYFFDWHVAFVKPAIEIDGLLLADLEEIAVMKLEAVTTRKERKDFIDIAFLLKRYDLRHLLSIHKLKYPFISGQFVLESLMAVDYADSSEQPKMIIETDWRQVKIEITDAVKQYINEAKKSVMAEQAERLKKAEELLKNKGKKD